MVYREHYTKIVPFILKISDVHYFNLRMYKLQITDKNKKDYLKVFNQRKNSPSTYNIKT